MYRISYLITFSASVLALIASAGLITYLITGIDENSGNAGAFEAGLSFGIGIFGVVITMVLGFISGSIAYVYSDKLPSRSIYKIRWSFMLCIPFLLWVSFLLLNWLQNTL
jgi:hypothetical protein